MESKVIGLMVNAFAAILIVTLVTVRLCFTLSQLLPAGVVKRDNK
jgi:hypothetical protein